MKPNIFLVLFVVFISLHSFAQGDKEDLKNKIMKLDLSQAWRVNWNSGKIIFEITDTMELSGR